MLTGAGYRESLNDGRRVWLQGVGAVDDVATHPLTRPMVDAYAAWYDRHSDPAWRDILFIAEDGEHERRPIAFETPASADDFVRLGRQVSAVALLSGGNITHTPGYGALIALGLLDTVKAMGLSQAEASACAAYRDDIARTGRFLTFCAGGAPVGLRYRENEADRTALRIVRERDDGVVISGKVSMHTSSPFAHDVFISGGTPRGPGSDLFAWFIVPVGAPGVRVIARKPAAMAADPFTAPLSHHYDELDAQLWLDDVFIPFERVFSAETPLGSGRPAADGGAARNSNLPAWLFWHQARGWLAKLEFSLGLALAASDVMGYRANPVAIEQLIDLVADVQIARSCLTAAELEPELSDGGFLMPGQLHLASASLHILRVRQSVTETLRRLPGSTLPMAPALSDLEDPTLENDLEEALGGGGYTARQRAALLNLIWDNVSSGLDGRASTYEMHANGGVGAWRMRLRTRFKDYNALANAVLRNLPVEIPSIDVSGLAIPAMGRPPMVGARPAQSAALEAQGKSGQDLKPVSTE